MRLSETTAGQVLAVGTTAFTEAIQSHLTDYLTDTGVVTAATAMEGLEELATAGPVDCIVSEHDLPDSDGLALLRRVEEREPAIPFVLAPATADTALVTEALAAGVTECVPRAGPATQQRLAHTVTNAVETRREQRQSAVHQRSRAALAAASHGGTLTLDSDGEVVAASERATEILGRSEAEMTGQQFGATDWEMTDLDGEPIPDEDVPFASVLDTGEPVRDARLTIALPTGGRRTLSLNAAAETTDETPGRVVVSVMDITEQVQREEALASSRSRLRALFDEAADPVFVIDTTGTILDVSTQAVDTLGYDREQLVGLPLWNVETAYDKSELVALLDEVPDDDPVTVTGRHSRADGTEYPVEVSLSRLDVDGETRFVYQARDVSDERTSSERLAARDRSLRALSRELAEPDKSFEEQVSSLLELGCERLDLPVGCLTFADEGRQHIVAATGDHDLVASGEHVPLGQSHSQRTSADDELVAVENVVAEDWDGDSASETDELGCYLGGAVTVDGDRCGTLWFAGESERLEPFTEGEKAFVEVLRQVVSHELDHRETRERLERQRDLFQQTEQMADIGAWELDVTEETLYWSDQVREIYGVDAEYDPDLEEALSFFHPDDRETIEQAVEEVIDTGDSYDRKVRLETAAGDQRWVRTIGEPRTADGTVTHIRGTIQDVTERENLLRRLQTQQRTIDTVTENVPLVLFAFDEDGVFTRSEGQALTNLGLEPGEAVGKSVFDLYEDEEEIVHDARRALDGEHVSVTNRAGDHTFESWYHPITDDEGEVEQVVGLSLDITAREERKRELETYERAINAAGDIIYQLDECGEIVMVNDAVSTLDYTREEVLGDHVSTVMTEEGVQAGTAAIEELLSDPSTDVVSREFELTTAGGERVPVESRITALYDDGEFAGTIGITRNVSGRQAMEREIREQNRNLEAILENVPTILFEIDADGQFTHVRGQGLESLARGREFFEGQSAVDVFAEYPVIQANTEQALSGERVNDVVTFEGAVFETWYEPVVVDGTVERVVVTAMDVTEREAHEQTLANLHDATRDLLSTTRQSEVASVVFRGADEILDLDTVAVLLYDEREGGLVPAEYTESIQRALGTVPSVWPEDSNAWTAFQQGIIVTRPDLSQGSAVFSPGDDLGAGSCIPLGEYGVLVVGDPDRAALDGQTLDLADTLAATAEAGLARVDREQALQERERELREEKAFTEALIDSLPDLLFALDSDGDLIRWNDHLMSVTELDPEAAGAGTVAAIVPEEQRSEASALVDDTLAGTTGRTELDVETTRDGRVPYEFTTAPVRRDGAVVGIVGIGRDISEQKEHERMLTALHNVTRELLRAESRSAIGNHVVRAAERSLDFDGVGVFLFDETENELRPIAQTDQTIELVGEMPTFGPGDGIAWDVFIEGESRIYDDVRADPNVYNPETPFRGELFIPLGDNGVLIAGMTAGGDIDERTIELVQILAANCEAALERAERADSLRSRDRELQQQNARLEQLKEINEKVRKIDHALVGAETRTEIQETVCERLAAVDRFEFAWFGSIDPVHDSVTPEAWKGTGSGYLDSISTGLDDDEPAAVAASSGESVIVETVAADLRAADWRTEALSQGFLSVAAVPLVYDGITYGVLTVYANEADAFTDMAQGVIAELGGTVAHALNAVERKRALLSDSHVELEFELPPENSALFELARRLDGHLHVDNALPQSDGKTLLYATVDGAGPDTVTAATADLVTIDRVREIGQADGSYQYEFRLTSESIASTVAEHGGILEDLTVDEAESRVVISLPETADVRGFIDLFQAKYDGVELFARRRQQTETDTTESGPPLGQLTPRQTEVIQVAYFNGFFEWPRESTGEEVAEALGVSPPTFLEHLRRAEAKLLSSLVEADPEPLSPDR